MELRKAELLQRIESDRDVLIDFLRRFIRCPSPNPPGDTGEAAGHIRNLLDQRGDQRQAIAGRHAAPSRRAHARRAQDGS